MLKELSLPQCLDNDEYAIRVNKKELNVLSDDEKYTILAFTLELTENLIKELLLSLFTILFTRLLRQCNRF